MAGTQGVKRLRDNRKAVLYAGIAVALAAFAVLSLFMIKAASDAGRARIDRASVAVPPVSDGQVSDIYGESADPDVQDQQGNPLFAFSSPADQEYRDAVDAGSVVPKYDSDGNAIMSRGFATPDSRRKAFRKTSDARLAAVATMNGLVAAILTPNGDVSQVESLGGDLMEYIPSEGTRAMFSDARYSTCVLTVSHFIDSEGVTVSGTMEVTGEVSVSGVPAPFRFYTDWETDPEGKLVALENFKLILDGKIGTKGK